MKKFIMTIATVAALAATAGAPAEAHGFGGFGHGGFRHGGFGHGGFGRHFGGGLGALGAVAAVGLAAGAIASATDDDCCYGGYGYRPFFHRHRFGW
jgi:hypothetical protein